MKSNPNAFLRYTKNKLNFKNAILDLVDNGKILSDDNGKAKAFNTFFKSAFKEKLECLPDFNLNVKSSIEHVPFPADKIKKKPDNLNPCKSPGADGLHPRILKLSNELSLPLSFSQNHSVKENYFKTRRMLLLLHCIKKEKKSLPATTDQIVLLLLFGINN